MQLKNVILIFGTLAQLGGFVSLNFPSFLNLQILKVFDINQLQFSLLFIVVNLPNSVIPFIVGYVTRKTAPRKSLLFMTFFVLLGQTLCTLALFTTNFAWMIMGRFFIGFGYANSNQAKAQMVNKWFEKQNAFAFQMFPTVGRMGVFASAFLFAQYQQPSTQRQYQEIQQQQNQYQKHEHYQQQYVSVDAEIQQLQSQMENPFILVNLINLFSFICSICMYLLDKTHDNSEQRHRDHLQTQYLADPNNVSMNSEATQDPFSRKTSEQKKKELQEENKSIKQIFTEELNIEYWILLAISAFGLMLYFPMVNNLQVIFKEQFKIQGQYTVYMQILPPLMSSVLGMFLGKLMDSIGKRINFIFGAAIFSVLSYGLAATLDSQFMIEYKYICALVYMLNIGLFWSFFSVVESPCISIAIKKEYLGFVIGINQCVQNNVLTLSALMVGDMVSPGYFYSNPTISYNGMMLVFGVLFLTLAILLYVIDNKYYGSRLQMSYNQQEQNSIQLEDELEATNNILDQMNILDDLELQSMEKSQQLNQHQEIGSNYLCQKSNSQKKIQSNIKNNNNSSNNSVVGMNIGNLVYFK